MKFSIAANTLFYIYSVYDRNVRFHFILNVFLLTEIPATEPPQLPGRCPETDHTAWIPFHGHCYYVESSYTRNWGQASLECLRMGKCHV